MVGLRKTTRLLVNLAKKQQSIIYKSKKMEKINV